MLENLNNSELDILKLKTFSILLLLLFIDKNN